MEFFVVSIVAIIGTISFMGYEGSFKRLAKLENKVCARMRNMQARLMSFQVLFIVIV